jgi:hypothetical protein
MPGHEAMNEHQEPAAGGATPAPGESSGEEVRLSLEAEIREMEKYKWCLGVQLQHDPLQDRSLNDIYTEWIDKYAAEFRKHWQNPKNNQ